MQVNPEERLNCDGVLSLQTVRSRLEKIRQNINLDDEVQTDLLQTIKLPKDLNEIQSKLPKKKNYSPRTHEDYLEGSHYTSPGMLTSESIESSKHKARQSQSDSKPNSNSNAIRIEDNLVVGKGVNSTSSIRPGHNNSKLVDSNINCEKAHKPMIVKDNHKLTASNQEKPIKAHSPYSHKMKSIDLNKKPSDKSVKGIISQAYQVQKNQGKYPLGINSLKVSSSTRSKTPVMNTIGNTSTRPTKQEAAICLNSKKNANAVPSERNLNTQRKMPNCNVSYARPSSAQVSAVKPSSQMNNRILIGSSQKEAVSPIKVGVSIDLLNRKASGQKGVKYDSKAIKGYQQVKK